MAHLRTITRTPRPAQEGRLELVEVGILGILAVFFNRWDNFAPVFQNLQKFYQKTP